MAEDPKYFGVNAFKGGFAPLVATARREDYGDKLTWHIELPPPHDPMRGVTTLKQPGDILDLIRILRRDIEAKDIPLKPWNEPPIPTFFEEWYAAQGFPIIAGLKALVCGVYDGTSSQALDALRVTAAGGNRTSGIPAEVAQLALDALAKSGRIPV